MHKMLSTVIMMLWLGCLCNNISSAVEATRNEVKLTETTAPNPLYLTSLDQKLWWNSRAGFRLPVLITEPSGMDRLDAPVSIFCNFPAGTDPASIRVVTPTGREIFAQICQPDPNTGATEIILLLTIYANQQLPLFVYYGREALPALTRATDLICSEEPENFCLANNRLEVKIAKQAALKNTARGSLVTALRPVGRESSEIASLYDYFMLCGHSGIIRPGAKAVMTENGTLRKTVEFDDGSAKMAYSLYSKSNLIFYRYVGTNNLQRFTTFSPGGDMCNDQLYYESAKGVKKLPVENRAVLSTPFRSHQLGKYLSAGWFAFCDESQQTTVGEIFDPNGGVQLDVSLHAFGYQTTLGQNAQRCHGALFCSNADDFRVVRQAYLAWKSPLIVSSGKLQAYREIKPVIPKWGQNFWRVHMLQSKLMIPDANSARRPIEIAEEQGANFFTYYIVRWHPWTKTFTDREYMQYLDELIQAAHVRGMGVMACAAMEEPVTVELPPIIRQAPPSAITNYPLYIQNVRDICRLPVDSLFLLDEFRYRPSSDAVTLYRQRYKMDPQASPDFVRMKEPAQFNEFCFRTDAINGLVKDMCRTAREIRPEIHLFHVTSPGNMTIHNGSVHDLESQSDDVTTTSVDLYSNEFKFLNYFLKHTRGAQGNYRPVLTFTGNIGNDTPDFTRLNHLLHLFSGANSFIYYSLDFASLGRDIQGAREIFNLLDYTGLGDYLARCYPVKFAAVLRDRDNFFGELQRGNCGDGERSVTDQRIDNLTCALTAKNIQNDIVFSKHFQPELMRDYKVLIVPDNADLTDRTAGVIRDYLGHGGIVMLEGDTLLNAQLAAMSKVAITGTNVASVYKFQGKASDIKDVRFTLVTTGRTIESRGAEVWGALENGTPALTVTDCGKGKVIYSALNLSSKAFSEGQVGILLKILINRIAGKAPMETDDGVYVNLLTDGSNYFAAVYNPGEHKTVNLKLNVPRGDTLVGMRSGKFFPIVDGQAKVGMKSDDVEFYRVVTKTEFTVPQNTLQTNTPIYQSQNPAPLVFMPVGTGKGAAAAARVKEIGKIYVGIYLAQNITAPVQMGAQAIYQMMNTLPDVKAEYLDELTLEQVGRYDVVIVPNAGIVGDGIKPAGWESSLRQYARTGGGVLLIHHAVGFGSFSKASLLFPEIGQGSDFTAINIMEAVGKHPVITGSSFQNRHTAQLDNPAFAVQYRRTAMRAGDTFESGFPDYIVLNPGPEGEVVARGIVEGDKGGTPAMVVGRAGQGKVVLSGMNIGCKARQVKGEWVGEEALSVGEEKMLINSVYWLAEREGKK